jgi:hypothetical protein
MRLIPRCRSIRAFLEIVQAGILSACLQSVGDKKLPVEIRGLPLIHDKTVDEWGTAVLGYFLTGAPTVKTSLRG